VTAPRVLYKGELEREAGWRIVRVILPESRREDPTDDGVRDLIEVTDGADLMGQQRWTQVDGKSAGVSTLVRLVHALKRELLARDGE
jgi:hypothetical protein